MSDMERLIAACRDDLPFFARTCLKVKDKSGAIVPLVFNESQMALHEEIERQLREVGFVRMIVLKGRRQGISTYVAARFYWRTSLRKGVNTYILSHEQASSDLLFEIVDRFQRNSPIAPSVGASNEKELVFDRLDGGYRVGTAGQKAGGRGQAVKLFHGSEVAFWPNAAAHFAASVQAVPLLPDTEVILESTANGPSGEFHGRVDDSMAGKGDYRFTFLPWTLERDNARPVPPDFTLSDEAPEGEMSERELADAFGASNEQLFWRRNKMLELRDPNAFKQEYPITAHEAFVASGEASLISPLTVLRSRKAKRTPAGPRIIGIDPASMGGDRFAIASRRGCVVEWVKSRVGVTPTEGAAWVKAIIDDYRPERAFIDYGGGGDAISSILRDLGPTYRRVIRTVNFGSTSQHRNARPEVPGPENRRAEMWGRLRDYLEDDIGAQIPDQNDIQADLCKPRPKFKSNGAWLLESKDGKSTDLGDAIALTFADLSFLKSFRIPDAPRNDDVQTLDGRDYARDPSDDLSWMAF